LEGWKLVSAPYWEWNGIDKGSEKARSEKKARYLQKLLDEAIVLRSTDDASVHGKNADSGSANTTDSDTDARAKNVSSKWDLWQV
jgi:hypothetical protein